MSVLDVFRSTVGAGRARLRPPGARRDAGPGARAASVRRADGRIADGAGPCRRHGARRRCRGPAVYRAAWTKDMGAPRVSREAAMAKLYATETAQKVIDAAVQLHGGDGVRAGRVTEQLYREIRACASTRARATCRRRDRPRRDGRVTTGGGAMLWDRRDYSDKVRAAPFGRASLFIPARLSRRSTSNWMPRDPYGPDWLNASRDRADRWDGSSAASATTAVPLIPA